MFEVAGNEVYSDTLWSSDAAYWVAHFDGWNILYFP